MKHVAYIALKLPMTALAAPVQITHQVRVLDALGAPAEGSVNMEIRL